MSWHTKDWTRLIGGLAAATAIAGSGGLLGPGVAAALGAGGTGAAGAGAAGATGATGLGATLAGGAGAAGAGAAGAAGGGAGFGSLLAGSTLGKAAIGTGINAGLSAATPQKGMTTPGQVPQMTPPDPQTELQELMRKSKLRRGGAI